MRNFRLIQAGIDVEPFLSEIARNEEWWRKLKADVLDPRQETLFIQLRQGVSEKGKAVTDSQTIENTDAYASFPLITSWVDKFAINLGELSWMLIISLRPEGEVYPHADRGEYYRRRDRYHLVLQSKEGSMMKSGGEEQIFREGELWWFNHKVEHQVFNPSRHPRIHLIFDILPKQKEKNTFTSFFNRAASTLRGILSR